MKCIDLCDELNPEDFGKAVIDHFIPEMDRLAKKKNIVIFDPESPLLPMVALVLFRDLIDLADRAAGKYESKNGSEVPVVRIEMQTFEDSMIRFRFIIMDKNKEPLLGEKENPIALFLASREDLKRFKNEGYSHIEIFDYNFPGF